MGTDLRLYEDLTLLALKDEKGTFATEFIDYGIAGAVLAEWLLDGRISLGGKKGKTVDVHSPALTGDKVFDPCIERLVAKKRPADLQTWVSRLAGVKRLRHLVADSLVARGILARSEGKVLGIFPRVTYPEANPAPEREIIEELRSAIFGDDTNIDPRTAVVVALAHGCDLLNPIFGRKELKPRKARIKAILEGSVVGNATKEVIEACQAAITMAAILPAMMAATTAAST